MSDLKISQLTPAISLTGNELLPLAISGTNESATTAQVAGLAASSLTNKYIPYSNAGVFADSYLVNDTQKVSTKFSISDWGLVVDFASQEMWLGDSVNGWGYSGETTSGEIKIGDFAGNFGPTQYLDFDLANSRLYTFGNGQYQGLDIKYGSQVFSLGLDFTTGYTGFVYDFSQAVSKIGDPDFIGVFNGTGLVVGEDGQGIYTKNAGVEMGLKLDFASNAYFLGNPINQSGFSAFLNGGGAFAMGDFNNLQTYFQVDLNTNVFSSFFNGSEIGLKLDFASNLYDLANHNLGSGLFQVINSTQYDITLGYGNYGGDGMGYYFNYYTPTNGASVQLGDWGSIINNTKIFIDITNSTISFNTTGGKYQFAAVAQYANNAAAITGGLTAGMIYRITGTDHLGIVH